MFSLKPSFNGYESSMLGKKYVIKYDAIGNILRNTLGTWGTCFRIHSWEHVGNTKNPKNSSFLFPSNLL